MSLKLSHKVEVLLESPLNNFQSSPSPVYVCMYVLVRMQKSNTELETKWFNIIHCKKWQSREAIHPMMSRHASTWQNKIRYETCFPRICIHF